MVKMPELNVCPFCGTAAYLDSSEDEVYYDVQCIGCGARTDKYRSPKKAADAWNQRGGLIMADEVTPFTEQQYKELCARLGLDTKDAPKWFAVTRWTVEDVIAAAEEQGVTLTAEKAEAWWARNESRFQNLLVERGNEILADMDFEEG